MLTACPDMQSGTQVTSTHRRHGLFPPGDPLLAELKRRAGSHAFEKHMAGALSSYQTLPDGGWTTGDAACRAGFDLRMFYQSVGGGPIAQYFQARRLLLQTPAVHTAWQLRLLCSAYEPGSTDAGPFT
jgi:hypothetical protein